MKSIEERIEKKGQQGIEDKWRKLWFDAKIFEAERDSKKKKFFLIFAYPGISGYLHVGHLRSYTYPDIIARYKRMQGFNVLFPAGFHASGLPSVSFAEKIARGDENLISYLKKHNVSDEDIEKLKDPKYVVEFFSREYIKIWKQLGYSIDFRRVISTIQPEYNKFIEWQFYKLKERNLLIRKPHYAPFCPKCGPIAVDPSETDISKGGTAEILEFTVIKFICNDYVLPCATLRPETIFGVTNIWLNSNIRYVIVNVDNEKWILSKEAAEKISHQFENVKILNEISAEEFLNKECIVPVVNRKVPILNANFVSASVGTGIVMSVPAHAPYDFIALDEIKKFSPLAKKIEQISIIKTEGFNDFPAEFLVRKYSIKTQDELEKLNRVTEELYKREFHQGVMKENCGEFSGLQVSVAKEKVKEKLISEKLAIIMQEFSEEVICRCGEKVFIKRIPDQWFIKYSDSEIKEKAHECSRRMTIMPEEYKQSIHTVIEWYDDRACTRKGRWLGTKLPFDKEWIIEPIADSTLYPMTYLLSKYINENSLRADQLTEEFFDYVFLSRGNLEELEKKLNLRKEIIENLKKDFEYWYPLDMNFGGKEHMTVHFPVFVFNHVAIFNDKDWLWPKGIFVNWWVSGKAGEKISKSKGGAKPVMEVISKYTADSIRLYYAHIGSPHMDIEWDEELVLNYKRRLSRIWQTIEELQKIKSNEKKEIDTWLLSKLNSRIKKVREFMDDYKLREASIEIFYSIYSDVLWWLKRNGKNKEVARKVNEIWIKLMSPFTPFISEELWQMIGKEGFVSVAPYPEVDDSAINTDVELKENLLISVIDDLQNILKVTKVKPKKIFVYIAPEWKREVLRYIKKGKKIQEIIKDPKFKQYGKEISNILKKVIINEIPEKIFTTDEEFEVLTAGKNFIEKEFDAEVKIEKDISYDPKGRAKFSMPMKPGIYIEN
ncbi:MAG: leucine--tRNA ligase [Candidatus Altiarchaeota archaeon]